jgi:hypothetical protein
MYLGVCTCTWLWLLRKDDSARTVEVTHGRQDDAYVRVGSEEVLRATEVGAVAVPAANAWQEDPFRRRRPIRHIANGGVDNMKVKFVQIAATQEYDGADGGTGVPCLYGLTADGKVYMYHDHDEAWAPLPMVPLAPNA